MSSELERRLDVIERNLTRFFQCKHEMNFIVLWNPSQSTLDEARKVPRVTCPICRREPVIGPSILVLHTVKSAPTLRPAITVTALPEPDDYPGDENGE